MIFLSVGFFSCRSSTRSPRNNGKPASTSVANCRVKVVNTFGLTFPPSPGILMLRLKPPFFLPLVSVAAAFAFLSARSEEHTSELQSRLHLVCRLLLETKKQLCHLLLVYTTIDP